METALLKVNVGTVEIGEAAIQIEQADIALLRPGMRSNE
jgi:hypothetical protein